MTWPALAQRPQNVFAQADLVHRFLCRQRCGVEMDTRVTCAMSDMARVAALQCTDRDQCSTRVLSLTSIMTCHSRRPFIHFGPRGQYLR